MFYNVARLLREGIGSTRRYDLVGEIQDLDENNPGPTHVEGKIMLLRSVSGILVTGQAHAEIVQLCRRCLEPVKAELQIAIEEEFVPSIDIVTGNKLPIPDDTGEELVIDEHHILDLTEVIRQNLVIDGVNSGGLCRPGCRGLCPECGQNLNLGTCHCASEHIDARFAALAQLLEAKKKQE